MDWRKKNCFSYIASSLDFRDDFSVAVFCRKSKIELRLNSDEKIDTETGTIA